jgi:Tfp pilus assembly PilM family ATPase
MTVEEKRLKRSPRLFQRRLLAVSLEGNSLRLLSFWGGSPEYWGSIPFAPRLVRKGYVWDAEGLGEVVISTLRSRSLLPARIFCSFPGLAALTRILSLPSVRGLDVEGVVVREARRQMAVSPESHYLFWRVLPGKGVRRVFVAACPRESLQALLAVFDRGRLKLERLDLRALALARCVRRREAILVHVESNSVELVVVREDFPAMTRSVFLGDEPLPPEQISARVMEEAGRTISFYAETYGEPLAEDVPLYLTGGLAGLSGLADDLAATTGHPLAPLESPLPVPPDPAFSLALFMVNVGLLLRPLGRG